MYTFMLTKNIQSDTIHPKLVVIVVELYFFFYSLTLPIHFSSSGWKSVPFIKFSNIPDTDGSSIIESRSSGWKIWSKKLGPRSWDVCGKVDMMDEGPIRDGNLLHSLPDVSTFSVFFDRGKVNKGHQNRARSKNTRSGIVTKKCYRRRQGGVTSST